MFGMLCIVNWCLCIKLKHGGKVMLCYTGTFEMFTNHKSTKQVSLLNLYQLN